MTLGLPVRIALSALRRPDRHRFGPDRSQVADLHLPSGSGRGAAAVPFPVAVVLHGGYWQTRYGKLVMRPLCLELASHGWAVWNLEYRRLGDARGGGGGWPMTFDDVAAGIDALADLDAPLDLSRVDLVGHSAGGQLALWAAARASLPADAVGAAPRVRAARVLALAPVTDLWRAREHSITLLGGGPDEVPERWAQADPSRSQAPPVPALVVHPSEDETVSVKRSREYSVRTGVPLVETPGVHRDPIDPTSPAWAAALRWLQTAPPLL